GIAMPEAYGGSGLGISDAALMMQTIAASGAGMAGASAVHMNIFGLNPGGVFGTDAQKRRMLPPPLARTDKACFPVTAPNPRHHAFENARGAARRSLRARRRENLDLDRAGRQQNADPRAHHVNRGGGQTGAGLEFVLHHARPHPRGSARDREDGTQRGRFQS